MADVDESKKEKDKPEDKSKDAASSALAKEALETPAPKKPEEDASKTLPNTTVVDSNGKPKKALEGQTDEEKKKETEKADKGDKTKAGEAKPGDGTKAGEAKPGPKGEKVAEAKSDPEKLQKHGDGTFTSTREFPPGSEISKTEKHLDAKKKLIDETSFNSDGSKITTSADKQTIKTVGANGEETSYKLDKNGKLSSYTDADGSWSKQKDGSWKNENTGKTFEGERWVDEKGALHSKAKSGEHESRQLDGSKINYDSQDRPEHITDRLGGKTTLGYKGDEKQPSSVDYGNGKWDAVDADKTKWEKTLPNGTKQNWDGTVKVEDGKVTDVYKNGTEVEHKTDGSLVTTDKNHDLSEIAAGKQKFGIKYEPAGEPSKITMPDKSVLEKRADGWYNGDKKQYDSVTVDKDNKSISFKKADGSSELVDSKGTKHQYDAKGTELSSENADGTKTTFKRNEQGDYLGKETRSADGKTVAQYDNNDRVMQVDRDGQRVSIERDAKGNITKINDSLGPNSFESSDGGKTFKQAGTGIKIDGTPTVKANGDYEFRSQNKVLTRTRDAITISSGGEKTVLNNDGTSVSYNKAGEAEQSSTADGVRLAVKTEKDPAKPDAPAKVSEARVGDQVWTRSKEAGKEDVWTSNDGLQRKGEFSMDKSGNLHFADSASKGELVHNVDGSTVERDEKQNVRSTTTPDGKTTSYTYDANNRLTGMKMPDGTSFSRLPDRMDDKKQAHERWAQDGTSKIVEGTRSVDKEGTLRIKNEGAAETVTRRDGWQETQGENGQRLLSKTNADKSTVTKNDLGQIVETKTTDGQVRKFEYDAKGVLSKIDLGKEGKLSTADGGKTWTKDGTNPPETKTATFSLTPNGDLVEQKKVDGKAVEEIRKTDGSTLKAEGGRYTSLKIGEEQYKVGYGDNKQPNRFEDPKEKGAYWTSADNKTWTKHNADGTEDKATNPQKFSVGFDSQGNLLKQNNEKSPSTIERTSTDGSSATISADGRKLSEKVPDGKGSFTETNYQYDAQNKYTGREIKSPDGTVQKTDALGRTTEVSKGPFKRSFAYENEKYPNLVTSFNDNGNKYSLDKAALDKGQVMYKNEDPNKSNDVRPGMFSVGKDGSMSLKGENGFELTDRLDKTKLVKNTDGSMIEYRPDGLIGSTRDANGFLRSYKYELPNNKDLLGRPNRLSEVTYGEGPTASTYRTYDGFNWTQDGTGKQWKGFTSVDQNTGKLTDKHYYGSVAEYALDGTKVERTDKAIASNADEIRKTIDYWYNSNAIKDIRAQLADLDAEQTHMLKHVYQDRTGHGLWGDLYKRFDEGSDTHRWAEVQGYLNRKGNAGEDKAIQLAVNAEESSRWFWNRDRSQSEIAASTRNILGNATEQERKNYVDAFHNIYNKDLKSQFQPGGSGSGIMERDAYTKAVLSISLEKGKDIRTAEEEGKILDAALSGGRKLDYFQEATSLVKDSGREAWTKNGGQEKITQAFTTTRADEAGNTWEEVDKFAVQQATDFAETGALRPHTQIQKAAGVFSNDDNVIEHTLAGLKSEKRAQFADGAKLAKASPEERAKFTPKEQEALKFYNDMMDSFKSLHYFGVDKKVEKYIDQTLHKGGTDVAAKVAPIGGHWFNSNQVNAQAIESMDQKTFNQLLAGSRGTAGADNSITGGVPGDKRDYASEFHKQMATALEKNLGGGEYIEKAQKLLDEKVAKGLSINEAADKGDLDALRQKVPAFGNIPESQYKDIGAGYRLQQDLASGKIKDSDLTGDQRKQLEAYQQDKVVRPFMEGRAVAKQLNDIESGSRADRLFEGQRLETELAGKTPTPEQQAAIDFYKQNAKEIEGLTPALKNQVIERQREGFNKQLSEPGSKALEAYQKGIYDAVQQTTGRSLETKLKDNESFWGNDRKAMVDAVLNMKAEDRKLLASQTPEGEAARKALRDQFKEKFSNGAEDNARYKLIDSLLKQVETSKDAVPAAPVMGAKEQLLAKAAGLDGYSDKSATKIITDAIKGDKDGSESRKLAEDPEFKKAAIEAFKRESGRDDAAAEKAFNEQVKPLLETGRLTSDTLKEKHTSYDQESGAPIFDSRGYFKEGVLDASPRALAYLNSPEGAAEKAKMLETLKNAGPKEVYELAQNILKQGEVKPEDKLRAFTLNAGVTKEEAIGLMKSMTEEGPRVEIQNRYEAKYENFRASMLKQVDNKEYDEVFRATRHKDWTQDKEHLHAIKTVSATDAGLGARMASNYNTTHIEALNDFNRKIYEATSNGKTLDVKTLNELAANTEDRVKSFKDTKQATTDTVVTGVVTGVSLVAAPFTAGASLYALAGISTVMGLGAATLKYGLMGNDTNGAKEFAGDAFKYTALAFSNQFGAGNLGFKEATHLAGASTAQILKTEAANLLVHSTVGGIGNTIGEGGRQLIDDGKIDGKSLQIAFAQGFVFTGVMSTAFKGVGMAFKGGEHPSVPVPKGDHVVPEVLAGTAGLGAVTADVAKAHVPNKPSGQLHPGSGNTAAGELKDVFDKARVNEGKVLPKDAPTAVVKDPPATGVKDAPSVVKDGPAPAERVPANDNLHPDLKKQAAALKTEEPFDSAYRPQIEAPSASELQALNDKIPQLGKEAADDFSARMSKVRESWKDDLSPKVKEADGLAPKVKEAQQVLDNEISRLKQSGASEADIAAARSDANHPLNKDSKLHQLSEDWKSLADKHKNLTSEISAVSKARAQELERELNKFASERGLPPVKVQLAENMHAAGGYTFGEGVITLPKDALAEAGGAAGLNRVTFHEFTHAAAQDELLVRNAQRLAAADGKAGDVAAVQAHYKEATGRDLNADWLKTVSQSAEKKGALTADEIARAGDLAKSVKNSLTDVAAKSEQLGNSARVIDSKLKDLQANADGKAVDRLFNDLLKEPGGDVLASRLFGQTAPSEELSKFAKQWEDFKAGHIQSFDAEGARQALIKHLEGEGAKVNQVHKDLINAYSTNQIEKEAYGLSHQVKEGGDATSGTRPKVDDAPVRAKDTPGDQPVKPYDPAEKMDLERIDRITKKFSEGTREVPITKAEFEDMFKGFSEADRKLAMEVMEQSAPNMTPRALDDQLRNLQAQLDKIDPALRKEGITVFSMGGNDSAEMLAQLLRKNQDQLKVHVVTLDAAGMKQLAAEGMPNRALILGDLSTATAAQKQALSQVDKLYVSNINGFDKGVNFIDFGASQFAGTKGMQDKIAGIVEKAKALQAAEPGLSSEAAVKKILEGDTAKLATEINPKSTVLQPEQQLPGKQLRDKVGGSEQYRIGSMYDQFTAPQLTKQQLESYLASIKSPEIKSFAGQILEHGVEYKSYTQQLKEFHELHQKLMAELPPGTKPSDIMLVTGLEYEGQIAAAKAAGKSLDKIDNIGSQMISAKMYATANDLGSANFITAKELAALGPDGAKGKVLVYLDDFSLSGRQAAGVVKDNATMLKQSGGKVVVATMGKFETETNPWLLWQKDSRYLPLKDMDVTVLSNQTYKQLYDPATLARLGLTDQEKVFGNYKLFKPGHDSGLTTNILTPYGGPNNNMNMLDELQKATGIRGKSKVKFDHTAEIRPQLETPPELGQKQPVNEALWGFGKKSDGEVPAGNKGARELFGLKTEALEREAAAKNFPKEMKVHADSEAWKKVEINGQQFDLIRPPRDFWYYGKFPEGESAVAKVHVVTDGAADLGKLQETIIPALKNDPELAAKVSGWKTFDPEVGLGRNLEKAPDGVGQGAKAFTLYTKTAEDALAVQKRIDEILTAKGLGREHGISTGNVDSVRGSSNRVGIVRDYFHPADLPNSPVDGALLDRELAAHINSKLGVPEGQKLTDAQLRQVEKDAGIRPGTLAYDRNGELALLGQSRHSRISDRGTPRIYLDESNASKAAGDLTDRQAMYALTNKYLPEGYDPVDLASGRVPRPESLAKPAAVADLPPSTKEIASVGLGGEKLKLEPGGPSVPLGRYHQDGIANPSSEHFNQNVSREHGHIHQTSDGKVYITDNNSTAGTYIKRDGSNNWEKVQGKTEIKPGDKVMLAGTGTQDVRDSEFLTNPAKRRGTELHIEALERKAAVVPNDGTPGLKMKVSSPEDMPGVREVNIDGENFRLVKGGPQVWYYGKFSQGEAPVKIHVMTDGVQDLGKLQEALIPALNKNPELAAKVHGWKTFDPEVGAGQAGPDAWLPTGKGQGAKAFTIYARTPEDAVALQKEIDKFLTDKGLGRSTPIDTGNIDQIKGSSNRVGIVRDQFEPTQVDGNLAARLDKPLAEHIQAQMGLQPGQKLSPEQLRQVEKTAGLRPETLAYDRDNNLSLIAQSRSSGMHDGGSGPRIYLDEGKAGKEFGDLTDRQAFYALSNKYLPEGQGPADLAAGLVKSPKFEAPPVQALPQAAKPSFSAEANVGLGIGGDKINLEAGGPSVPLGRSHQTSLGSNSPHENLNVSRNHATLSRDADGKVFITDNNSSNGTYIKRNGSDKWETVTGRTEVQPGDKVMLGGTSETPSAVADKDPAKRFGTEVKIDAFDRAALPKDAAPEFPKRMKVSEPNDMPFLRQVEINGDQFKLIKTPQQDWFYGKLDSGPPGAVKVHVTTDGNADLGKLQEALIPELEKNPALASKIHGWKTFDPKVGAGTAPEGTFSPTGKGQEAKGFTVFTKTPEDAVAVQKEIDRILTEKNLGREKPIDTGNIDKVTGSSNRVGIVRDFYQITRMDSDIAAKLDKPLADHIHSQMGLKPGERLTSDQLRQVEKNAGLRPNTLGYDRDSNLSLAAQSNGSRVREGGDGPRLYLDESSASKQAGDLTDRQAYYALANKYLPEGKDPTDLLLGTVKSPSGFDAPMAPVAPGSKLTPEAKVNLGIGGEQLDLAAGGPALSVGRSHQQTLGADNSPFNNKNVSRSHAVVNREADGRVFITDNNSSNGTYIQRNGSNRWEAVTSKTEVQPGDRVMLGGTSDTPSVAWDADPAKRYGTELKLFTSAPAKVEAVANKIDFGGMQLRVEADGTPLEIGRNHQRDALEDVASPYFNRNVSREHLQLTKDASGKLYAKDKGSTYGTYIMRANTDKWEALVGTQEIKPGDRLMLGGTGTKDTNNGSSAFRTYPQLRRGTELFVDKL